MKHLKMFLAMLIAVSVSWGQTWNVGDPTLSNVTATLSDGVMTISGTGNMRTWTSSGLVPWANVRDNITSVVINDGVTSIGQNAFQGSTALESVVIGSDVTSIGNLAFGGCANIRTINYNATNVTVALGTDANHWLFNAGTNEDVTVNIGNNVTEIPNNLFYVSAADGRPNVTNLNLGNGVQRIEGSAFRDLSEITNLSIPNSVTFVGSRAFWGMSSLEDVVIGADAYLDLGVFTFTDNTSLRSIVIGNRVKNIPVSTFEGCTSLESIVIGDSVTFIGGSALKGCVNLKSITFNARNLSSNLQGITNDGLRVETHWLIDAGTNEDITINIGSNVTRVPNNLFRNLSNIRTINYNAANVTVTLGTGENHWLHGAGTNGDITISIGSSVTQIPISLFSGCANIRTINYNATNVTNNLNVSTNNHWLSGAGTNGDVTINIGSNVTRIPNLLFRNLNNIRTINYNATNVTIDLGAGGSYWLLNAGRSGPVTVNIGNNVTRIPNNLFNVSTVDSRPDIRTLNLGVGVQTIGASAFRDLSGLASVTIPNSVTSIGNSAFEGCTSLENVIIGDGVTSLNGFNFRDNTSLKSIVIGNSVTSIDESAFQGCTSLETAVIGNSVTSIGASAFRNAAGLSSITIPGSVTSIGNLAFGGCTNIRTINYNATNVTNALGIGTNHWLHNAGRNGSVTVNIGDNVVQIPDNLFFVSTPANRPDIRTVNLGSGIQTIGESAFRSLQFLSSISIPDGVTSIGNSAFQGCAALEGVVIPNSVTSIGDFAFDGCASLGSAIIGNNVTFIGESAFRGATGLNSITIPSSVTFIGNLAFGSCANIRTINYNTANLTNTLGTGTNHWLHNAGRNGSVTVNIGDNVVQIPDNLFFVSTPANRPDIRTVNLGSGIQIIGESAFRSLQFLSSISIPDGVTSIGNSAFQGCTALESVIIPNSVTSIGESAFRNLSGLTQITIPNSVTSIGNLAFDGCISLEDVVIGDGVTSLNGFNFRNNTSLKSIVIGNNVASIGNSAFEGCTSLEGVVIPNSVVSIGNSAFRNATGLTQIIIPDNVTSIGSSAFRNLNGLTQITIPDNVTSIGNFAFDGCTSLEDVIVGNGVTSLNGFNFRDNTSLKSIVIGNSVISIDESAFEGSTSLESIVIGSNVASIGESAFRNASSLTQITIPDNVTSIGNLAFGGCTNIRTINYNATDMASSLVIGTNHWLHDVGINGNLTVNIGNNVEHIPNNLFSGRANIRTINYNATNLTNNLAIGTSHWLHNVGTGTSGDVTVNVGDNVERIPDNLFFVSSGNRPNIITVNLGSGVQTIGESAFRSLPFLSSIIIPDGVQTIGESAFRDLSVLNSIIIPGSVTSIGSSAFSGCWGLNRADFLGRTEAINFGANVFLSTLPSLIIYGHDENTSVKNIAATNSKQFIPYHFAMSLSQSETLTFAPVHYGYTTQHPEEIELTWTSSNYPLSAPISPNIFVSLSGENPSAFILSTTTINNVTLNGKTTFTVAPIEGLSAGTYTATVTVVEINDGVLASFDVSFTVLSCEHNYVENTIIYASCTEDGKGNMVCSVCGGIKDDSEFVIPATGHTPGNAATCTTPQTCTVCEAVIVEELDCCPICGFEDCACNPTSIRDIAKTDSRGIWFVTNPVSDVAELRVAEGMVVRVVIYDALGNVVFDSPQTVWDLRNPAGRRVAEGMYLVVVEARDRDGRIQRHSTKLGVKR